MFAGVGAGNSISFCHDTCQRLQISRSSYCDGSYDCFDRQV